jgi:hypothetical protein
VNRDDYADVVVGAYEYGSSDNGKVYVFHGSATGLSRTPNFSLEGSEYYDKLGISVDTAGDVDGDGYDDIIVGADSDHPYDDTGYALVLFGSPTGITNTRTWRVDAEQPEDWFGNSVSTAGDVNGDGYADVMISAILFDSGEENEGKVYLYYGSPSGPVLPPAWVTEGNQVDEDYGSAISQAGDVNGDGLGDILVGAPDFDTSVLNAGRAYAYYGRR